MRDIINQQQADMLAVLAVCDTDRSNLIKQSGIYKHLFTRDMPDLRERNLVDAYHKDTKRATMYTVTMAGRRALSDYIKHKDILAREPEKAQPDRRNLFEFPVWVPTKSGFVRNLGHKHILSRGF